MGKLIVIEGTDGSGKSTQFKLLTSRLEAENRQFQKLVFPQYSEPSSALIRMYLGGEFGTKPSDVNAYAASAFYAVDRYASFKKVWGQWYEDGGLVVSDRYCFGSTPGREGIELKDDEDALTQICLHCMEVSECARYIADEKVLQRRETADRLAKEFKAEGIIYEQMKYCDYWGFERALVSHIMHDEYGWPVLSIDRLYNNGNSGQLRTRVQAFVESLEIKRIHSEEGK